MIKNQFRDSKETAEGVINHILELMETITDRYVNIAFSGGSTPSLLFDIWAKEYKEKTNWNRLNIFWVDERCVAPSHPESNYGVMKSLLLNNVPIPEQNIFRMKGEDNPIAEADRYNTLIRDVLPTENGTTYFDLVLLGIGDDGHTASLFPDNLEALKSDRLVITTTNPYSKQHRITITAKLILDSKEIIFLVNGASKTAILKKVLDNDTSLPSTYIVQKANNLFLYFSTISLPIDHTL